MKKILFIITSLIIYSSVNAIDYGEYKIEFNDCSVYQNQINLLRNQRARLIRIARSNIAASYPGVQFSATDLQTMYKSISSSETLEIDNKISFNQDKYKGCTENNNNIEGYNEDIDNKIKREEELKICSELIEKLNNQYSKATPHIKNLFNNDTISYNLRELTKIISNYKKNYDKANNIYQCIKSNVYKEYLSYFNGVRAEVKGDFKDAIFFYKESIGYIKKDLSEEYKNDLFYNELVNRLNNISLNNNVIGLCGLDSYMNNYGNCICREGYTWKYENNNSDYTCVKKEVSCGLNSSLNSDGKCSCNTGYKWEDENKYSNLNCTKIKTTVTKTNDTITVTNNTDDAFNKKVDKIFEKLEGKFSKYSEDVKIKKYKSLVIALEKYKEKKLVNNSLIKIIERLIYLLNHKINSECNELDQLLSICK